MITRPCIKVEAYTRVRHDSAGIRVYRGTSFYLYTPASSRPIRVRQFASIARPGVRVPVLAGRRLLTW